MENTTQQQRLKHLIATYGADTARWPDEWREADAPDVLAAELQTELREARALDDLLVLDSGPDVPPGTMKRVEAFILSSSPATIRARRESGLNGLWQEFGWLFAPAVRPGFALLAASLAAGLYLGQADFMDPISLGLQVALEDPSVVSDDNLFGLPMETVGFVEDTS